MPLSGSFPPSAWNIPKASISVRTLPTLVPTDAEEGRDPDIRVAHLPR